MKDEIHAKRKVFLETSIQIDRLLHTSRRKALIRRNLQDKEVYTSTYVLMEFQRTILKDICYICSLVETELEADEHGLIRLSEVDIVLSGGGGAEGFSMRVAKRTRLITAAIKEEFPGLEIVKTELLEYLQFLIDVLRYEFFEYEQVQNGMKYIRMKVLNETDTALAKCDFACGNKACTSCNREQTTCRCHEVVQANWAEVRRVKEAFEQAPRKMQDQRMIEAVDDVAGKRPLRFENFRGQLNCWALGDTIIALEAPVDAAIYTKDKHYQIICSVLGKELYQETP